MKERICVLFLAVCLLSGMALAAPSYLGTTGLIFVPSDVNLKAGDFSANFHGFNLDTNPWALGVSVGVTDDLELGLVRIDPDVKGESVETALNAKYSVLEETSTRPSITIGAVDAGGVLDPSGDPGFYAVIGKNVTSAATGLSGEPVGPIRLYLGVGTGIYDGFFAAADWSFNSKATLMVEFLNGLDIKHVTSERSVFNAGFRFAISSGLRGDISLINGNDLGYGISFTKLSR